MMISAASSGSSNVAMRVRILVGADRTAEQMSASLALGHIGIHVGERPFAGSKALRMSEVPTSFVGSPVTSRTATSTAFIASNTAVSSFPR
jgi:hypothetical protein